MPNDKVVGLIGSSKNKIFAASKNGKGFISYIEYFITNQRKGKQFFNLKNNDSVIKVFLLEKTHIVCVTKLQKMLAFDISLIPELQRMYYQLQRSEVEYQQQDQLLLDMQ